MKRPRHRRFEDSNVWSTQRADCTSVSTKAYTVHHRRLASRRPGKKEFTRTELAGFAGISTGSVRRHIDTLVELDIVAETAGGKRYHYDLESSVGQRVVELNGEINAVGTTTER